MLVLMLFELRVSMNKERYWPVMCHSKCSEDTSYTHQSASAQDGDIGFDLCRRTKKSKGMHIHRNQIKQTKIYMSREDQPRQQKI